MTGNKTPGFECNPPDKASAPVRFGNIKAGIPADLPEELVTTLVKAAGVRIELIVSHGHTSPPGFWYDQDENESVFLLEGAARLEIDDQGERSLQPGDWVDIKAHVRHRVSWTSPDQATVWLAVFYRC
jgi:cupin 2 domain-containing protein